MPQIGAQRQAALYGHRVRVSLLLLAGFFCLGCNRGEGNAKDLAVSSDKEARAVVTDALKDLAGGDVDGVLAKFCDQSDEGRRLALEILNPAKGRADLVIARSEAAWKGAVPFFYVEVTGGKDGGGVAYVHGFGVRVRDGCLDRAVGATVLPRKQR